MLQKKRIVQRFLIKINTETCETEGLRMKKQLIFTLAVRSKPKYFHA